MLAGVTRVLVAAGVIPGPAVKATVLNVCDVIGRQIIAERVALVSGTPEIAGFRLDGFADAVADAGSKDSQAGAIGIELQHVGAVNLGGIVISVVHIRARAHGNEHFLAIAREDDVPSPMAAAIGIV